MEGLELNLDNILDENAINLFESDETQEQTSPEEQQEDKTDKQTTEIDPNSLFEEPSESVGSESEGEENTLPNKGNSTSPDNDFFSSIAEAFMNEGILPNLNEESVKNIKSAKDFRDVIEDYLKSELDEQQQRVKEALDNNVEVSAIKQYEDVLGYLNNISENLLRDEGTQGEDLRKRLIYQDYINRGFSAQRAEKEVNRSLSSGTDIDDAIDALNGCKAFYQKNYNSVIEEAKQKKAQEEEDLIARSNKIKDAITNPKNKVFGEFDIDSKTRQQIYDNISKPVYRDPQTGEVFTAVQKYEMDNRDDFLIKVGMLYTLTDGFKSLDKLIGKEVKKGLKRGLKDLEGRINNTSRDSYGNLKFTSGVDDKESYIGKGLRLAL